MRKRGARRIRHVDPLAAFRAAGRQHPLDDAQKLHLGVALRTHLQALATGQADEMAFHNLAGGVNVSMVLAEAMPDNERLDMAIASAQEASRKLRDNGRRGRWLLDGPGLNAMKRWLDFYEAQLAIVSQQEAMNALDEVKRRVARGMIF